MNSGVLLTVPQGDDQVRLTKMLLSAMVENLLEEEEIAA